PRSLLRQSALVRDVEAGLIEAGEADEAPGLVAPVFQIEERVAAARAAGVRVALRAKDVELAGVFERKAPDQDRIDEREDGCVDADPERQRHHDHARKPL